MAKAWRMLNGLSKMLLYLSLHSVSTPRLYRLSTRSRTECIDLFPVLRQIKTNRYITLVKIAQVRFVTYLRSLHISTCTQHTHRARILVNWLNSGGVERWQGFFCKRDGRVRVGCPWQWWFEQLTWGVKRDVHELDEWEARAKLE